MEYIETGGARLPNEGPELEDFKDWETRFLFHKLSSLRDEPVPDAVGRRMSPLLSCITSSIYGEDV